MHFYNNSKHFISLQVKANSESQVNSKLNPAVTRVFSSSLLRAIIAPNYLHFFEIFSNYFQILYIFAQIFKYFVFFCPFSAKPHGCPSFLE